MCPDSDVLENALKNRGWQWLILAQAHGGGWTLAQLSADFHSRLVGRKRSYDLETVHGE